MLTASISLQVVIRDDTCWQGSEAKWQKRETPSWIRLECGCGVTRGFCNNWGQSGVVAGESDFMFHFCMFEKTEGTSFISFTILYRQHAVLFIWLVGMVLVCSCCKSDPRYRVRQHCFHVHSSIHLSLNLTVLLHTPYTPLFQFRGFGSFLIFCVSYVSLQPHLTRHVASPPGAHPPPVTSKKNDGLYGWQLYGFCLRFRLWHLLYIYGYRYRYFSNILLGTRMYTSMFAVYIFNVFHQGNLIPRWAELVVVAAALILDVLPTRKTTANASRFTGWITCAPANAALVGPVMEFVMEINVPQAWVMYWSQPMAGQTLFGCSKHLHFLCLGMSRSRLHFGRVKQSETMWNWIRNWIDVETVTAETDCYSRNTYAVKFISQFAKLVPSSHHQSISPIRVRKHTTKDLFLGFPGSLKNDSCHIGVSMNT